MNLISIHCDVDGSWNSNYSAASSWLEERLIKQLNEVSGNADRLICYNNS